MSESGLMYAMGGGGGTEDLYGGHEEFVWKRA